MPTPNPLSPLPPGVPGSAGAPPSLASQIRALHATARSMHAAGATSTEWERLVADARRLAGHADAEGRAHESHGAPFGGTWADAAQDLRALALGASAEAATALDREQLEASNRAFGPGCAWTEEPTEAA